METPTMVNLLKILIAKNITVIDIKAPNKDIKNPICKKLPTIKEVKTTLPMFIAKAAENPKLLRTRRIMMFAKPNFRPGIEKGMKLSVTLKASDNASINP